MRQFWRISIYCHLQGMGGEFSVGRWHTAAPGKRLVYMSEHPALTLLETLVNMRAEPSRLPSRFQLLKIAAPDEILIDNADYSDFSDDWQSDRRQTQQVGDAWLAANHSALLKVPSAPSPESWNYLLNPLHPDARQVVIESCRWITYDTRLFGIREKS